MSNTPSVPPWLAVLAGVVGTAFLTLAPSFVGALVDAGAVSAEQAGQVASSHLLGLAVGPLLALLGSRALPARRWMAWGAAGLAGGHAICALTQSFVALVAAQFVAGTGGGLIYAAATVMAAGSEKPERMYAQMFIGMMVFGALGFVAMPELVPRLGLALAFGLAAALAFLLLPMLGKVPPSLVQDVGVSGAFRWSKAPVFILAALFLHYVANSAVWAYLDRIGVAAGLSAAVVGKALAAGMLASVLGGMLVGPVTRRFAFHSCLMAGVAAIAAATALLFAPGNAFIYGFAAFLYLAAMTFTVPIFQSLMASIDPSRRCALYGNLVLMLGQGVGPALGSQLIGGTTFATLLWTSLSQFGVAMALVAMAARIPAMKESA